MLLFGCGCNGGGVEGGIGGDMLGWDGYALTLLRSHPWPLASNTDPVMSTAAPDKRKNAEIT